MATYHLKDAWFCNKCHVGVLDPNKKVLAPNKLESVVKCPNCEHLNPTIYPSRSDPDTGWARVDDTEELSLIVGGKNG
jgi:hypothetical protein